MKQKFDLLDLQQWRESVACASCRQDKAGQGRGVRASERIKTWCFKVLVAVEELKTKSDGIWAVV